MLIIIPQRNEKNQKHYFNDASVDEVVERILGDIERVWQTYLIFHPHRRSYRILKDKVQVWIKGYDNNLLDKSIPLQQGDIILAFMAQDIPEDFILILEHLLAGYRYEAIVSPLKLGDEKHSE